MKSLAFALSICLCAASVTAQESEAENSDLAPDWVVSTADGLKISLTDSVQNDNKVVMVFWATWCRYCRELMPRLDTLHQQINAKAPSDNRPQVTFVAFNIWEDGNPQHYMSSKAMSLPLILRAEDIAKKYQVRGTPAVFVVGQNRRILYRRQPGQNSENTVAAVMEALAR